MAFARASTEILESDIVQTNLTFIKCMGICGFFLVELHSEQTVLLFASSRLRGFDRSHEESIQLLIKLDASARNQPPYPGLVPQKCWYCILVFSSAKE